MRLNNIVRSAAIAGASLPLALALMSCSRDYTVGYVYAVSASNGAINAYGIDYQTGVLTQVTGSPFTTPFTNPTRIIPAPNNKFVYVIGGSQNAQVEEFGVGTDGKLYGQNTYNLTGTYPTYAAIDSTGTFLYVTYQYQIGYSNASPGPGGVSIFKINSDNSLATPVNVNLGNDPVGIAISSPVCSTTPIVSSNGACTTSAGSAAGAENVYAYILDQGTLNGTATTTPTILGFGQNLSTGALTPLSGTNFSTLQGTGAGVVPSGIAVDATTRFVYVTDEEQNQVYGYTIARATTGNLTPMTSSPFGTGAFPVSLTIDPSARYVYTANYNAGTISQFTINQANGSLSGIAGSSFTAASGTTCVTVDPALGQFLYASNYEDASISGGKLNTATGAVTGVADSPFPTTTLPSCLTSVANGSHATIQVSPSN